MPTELKVYKKQRPAVSIFKGTPPFKGKAKNQRLIGSYFSPKKPKQVASSSKVTKSIGSNDTTSQQKTPPVTQLSSCRASVYRTRSRKRKNEAGKGDTNTITLSTNSPSSSSKSISPIKNISKFEKKTKNKDINGRTARRLRRSLASSTSSCTTDACSTTTTSSRTVSKEGQHDSKEEDNNNTIVSTNLSSSPSYNDSPIKLVSECENKINKKNSNILTTQSSWSSLVPSFPPPSHNDSPFKSKSKCKNKINKENSNILSTQSTQSSLSPLVPSSHSPSRNDSPTKSKSKCKNKVEKEDSNILTTQSSQSSSSPSPSHNDSPIKSVSKCENKVEKEDLNDLTTQSTQSPLVPSSPSPSHKDSPIKSVSKCENKVEKEDSNSLTTQSTQSPLVPSSRSPSHNDSSIKSKSKCENKVEKEDSNIIITQGTHSSLAPSSPSPSHNDSPINSLSKCKNEVEKEVSNILATQSSESSLVPSSLSPFHNDSPINSVSKCDNKVEEEGSNILSTQSPLFPSSPSPSHNDSPKKSVSKSENKVEKKDSNILTTQSTQSPLVPSSPSPCHNNSLLRSVSKCENKVEKKDSNILTTQSSHSSLVLFSQSNPMQDASLTTTSSTIVPITTMHDSKEEVINNTIASTNSPPSPASDSPIKTRTECEDKNKIIDSDGPTTHSSLRSLTSSSQSTPYASSTTLLSATAPSSRQTESNKEDINSSIVSTNSSSSSSQNNSPITTKLECDDTIKMKDVTSLTAQSSQHSLTSSIHPSSIPGACSTTTTSSNTTSSTTSSSTTISMAGQSDSKKEDTDSNIVSTNSASSPSHNDFPIKSESECENEIRKEENILITQSSQNLLIPSSQSSFTPNLSFTTASPTTTCPDTTTSIIISAKRQINSKGEGNSTIILSTKSSSPTFPNNPPLQTESKCENKIKSEIISNPVTHSSRNLSTSPSQSNSKLDIFSATSVPGIFPSTFVASTGVSTPAFTSDVASVSSITTSSAILSSPTMLTIRECVTNTSTALTNKYSSAFPTNPPIKINVEFENNIDRIGSNSPVIRSSKRLLSISSPSPVSVTVCLNICEGIFPEKSKQFSVALKLCDKYASFKSYDYGIRSIRSSYQVYSRDCLNKAFSHINKENIEWRCNECDVMKVNIRPVIQQNILNRGAKIGKAEAAMKMNATEIDEETAKDMARFIRTHDKYLNKDGLSLKKEIKNLHQEHMQTRTKESILNGTHPIMIEAAAKRARIELEPGELFHEMAFHNFGESVVIWNLRDFLSNSKWRDHAIRKTRKFKELREEKASLLDSGNNDSVKNKRELQNLENWSFDDRKRKRKRERKCVEDKKEIELVAVDNNRNDSDKNEIAANTLGMIQADLSHNPESEGLNERIRKRRRKEGRKERFMRIHYDLRKSQALTIEIARNRVNEKRNWL